jgi:molybdate transport system substrate-binding protein
VAVAFAACRRRRDDAVLVFAAASTEPPMREIVDSLRHELGVAIDTSFGASSDLARQIRAGARADLFLSADEAQVDALVRDGLCARDAVVPLLGNALVVVVPKSSSTSLASARDLVTLRRIATGDPRGVPLGVYARTWLQKAGVLDAVAPAIVPCVDARAALATVESDAVDAAIVYATDAARSTSVRVAFRVPDDEGPRITYPLALLTRATSSTARAVFDALGREPAKQIFRRHGFLAH